MNKTTVGIVSVCALIMSGCTTLPPQQPPARDIEPVLVGKPVTDRIQDTEIEINNQLGLLYKIKSGQKIGTYNVVTHNNDLDARIGSNMTIPQAYSKSNNPVKQDKNWTATPQPSKLALLNDTPVEATPPPPPNPLEKKIKKIDWSNNSLNKLATNLNSAINNSIKENNSSSTEEYKLVVKPGKLSDAYIFFTVENMTIEQVVEKLKKEVAPFADVSLVEQNKTLNILYK